MEHDKTKEFQQHGYLFDYRCPDAKGQRIRCLPINDTFSNGNRPRRFQYPLNQNPQWLRERLALLLRDRSFLTEQPRWELCPCGRRSEKSVRGGAKDQGIGAVQSRPSGILEILLRRIDNGKIQARLHELQQGIAF